MDAPFLLADLVEQLNSAHRIVFTAGERYDIGEQGAYRLADAQGRQQVDWSPRHHEEAVSERYIARGQALLTEIEARL
jgi:hypothetical protein